MARIYLRPEDMALLAQRFDATSEELSKTARRLDAELDEVNLGSQDVAFSVSRFEERSAVVRARLKRLADEVGVDAGLLASAADGGEFGAIHNWLHSLQILATGWGRADGPGAGSLGSAWSGVARGLGALLGNRSTRQVATGRGPEVVAEIQVGDVEQPMSATVDESMAGSAGGLFVSVSTGGDGDVTYLGGALGQTARAVSEAEDDSNQTPDWGGVWSRINADMKRE